MMAARALTHIARPASERFILPLLVGLLELLPLSVLLTSEDFPGQGGWGNSHAAAHRRLRWEFPQPESILSKLHTSFSRQVEKQPLDSFRLPTAQPPEKLVFGFL